MLDISLSKAITEKLSDSLNISDLLTLTPVSEKNQKPFEKGYEFCDKY